MDITDAQIHIWNESTPQRPWPESGFQFAHGLESYTAEQVLGQMDAAGVTRAILVPPSFEGDYNDVCLSAAQRYPTRFAVMGRIRLDDPGHNVPLGRWRDQPGMLGARLTFTRGASRDWIHDGTAEWAFAGAEAAGVPLMVHAPDQPKSVAAVAQAHPDLRLIVDHVGITGRHTESQIDEVIDGILPLAHFANVAVKASALPSVVSDPYPFPSLYDRIARVVDAFGPKRVFWGSDISRLRCTYREAVTHFTEELDLLDDVDLRWVMGRGLETWLDWPSPSSQ